MVLSAGSVSSLKVRSELVFKPGSSRVILISEVNGENVPTGLAVLLPASIFSGNYFNSSIFISPDLLTAWRGLLMWRARTKALLFLIIGVFFWRSLCWDRSCLDDCSRSHIDGGFFSASHYCSFLSWVLDHVQSASFPIYLVVYPCM